jgi:hypothetical protein
MASQPANVEISVQRRVRAYRQNLRHNSIHGLVNRLRTLVMSVPSEETLDLTIRVADTDDDVVTTALLDGRGSGLPVIRGLAPVLTFTAAVQGLTTMEFPIRVGGDVFLTKADGHLTEDLQQELRDL